MIVDVLRTEGRVELLVFARDEGAPFLLEEVSDDISSDSLPTWLVRFYPGALSLRPYPTLVSLQPLYREEISLPKEVSRGSSSGR